MARPAAGGAWSPKSPIASQALTHRRAAAVSAVLGAADFMARAGGASWKTWTVASSTWVTGHRSDDDRQLVATRGSAVRTQAMPSTRTASW